MPSERPSTTRVSPPPPTGSFAREVMFGLVVVLGVLFIVFVGFVLMAALGADDY